MRAITHGGVCGSYSDGCVVGAVCGSYFDGCALALFVAVLMTILLTLLTGFWRKQIDHICQHLKAHAQNDAEFRALIGDPKMGRVRCPLFL